MDNLAGPWRGGGGTSWDDGTDHGVRENTTFPSLYYPHERIFEDRSEKMKKMIDVGPWRGYGGTGWDDEIDHGVREITLEETRSEKMKKSIEVGPWRGYSGTGWDEGTYHGVREISLEENRSEKKEKGIEVGPWGGNGGTSWDDGIYHGVREITLVFGRCINSICVVYDKNGMPVAAEKHGDVGGNQTAEIKLQSPVEYLVSVSGYYSPMVRGGTPVIRSLTFNSNRRTLGPFGMEHGTPFSSPVDDGRIVGFKGRSGHHLDAIGFHVSLTKPTYLPGHTISFPNRRWRDDHIQGTKLAAPGYNRDPCGPSFLRQYPCVPSPTRHFGGLTAPVFWNLR